MKKNLCILLTLIMMLSLVGCGPLQNLLSQNSYESTIPSGAVSDSDDEDGENIESNDTDVEEEDEDSNNGGSIFDVRETIEETVLYDANDIKITAKKLTFEDEWYAATLGILIENNSDKDLNFSTTSVYVNGYQVSGWLYASVNAGKKSNESLTFNQAEFDRCGITTIADIELSLEAYETETYNDFINTDLIKIETSAADGFDYKYDSDGTVIFEDGDMKVVVQDLIPANPDEYQENQLLVYFYNGSDKKVYLSTQDTSVNGFMINVYGSCYLDAGKHAVIPITIYTSELEENDIDEITDIELSFEIRDYNSYDTIAEIGPVTITF